MAAFLGGTDTSFLHPLLQIGASLVPLLDAVLWLDSKATPVFFPISILQIVCSPFLALSVALLTSFGRCPLLDSRSFEMSLLLQCLSCICGLNFFLVCFGYVFFLRWASFLLDKCRSIHTHKICEHFSWSSSTWGHALHHKVYIG